MTINLNSVLRSVRHIELARYIPETLKHAHTCNKWSSEPGIVSADILLKLNRGVQIVVVAERALVKVLGKYEDLVIFKWNE